MPEASYHFWTQEQFRSAIARHEMLEFAEVHGRDFYGTPRSEVDPYRAAGTGVILVIDVQGAGQVRAAYPGDHLSIFVTPPAFDDLQHRLEVRGEAGESIKRRLHTAHAGARPARASSTGCWRTATWPPRPTPSKPSSGTSSHEGGSERCTTN